VRQDGEKKGGKKKIGQELMPCIFWNCTAAMCWPDRDRVYERMKDGKKKRKKEGTHTGSAL